MSVAGGPRRRAQLALAGLVLGLALAGCGGSSQVSPTAYVKSMCTALGNWRTTIQSAGVTLQSSGAASGPLPARKAAYQRFVNAMYTATNNAASALGSAGTPNLSGGEQAASRLRQAFHTATQRLGQAQAQAKRIRTDSTSTFQLGASAATAQIRSALQAISGAAPGTSPQLRQAAAREPACRALRGG